MAALSFFSSEVFYFSSPPWKRFKKLLNLEKATLSNLYNAEFPSRKYFYFISQGI